MPVFEVVLPCLRTHHTKGIVLRTVNYGETSVIIKVYTELFGVQSYIIKGIRQAQKKGASKAVYFQPAAILNMVVYNNELKNLQFVKEYSWAYLYQSVFFDVVKNAIATFIIEVFSGSMQEPEANPDLYEWLEQTLIEVDESPADVAANLPLSFCLQLAAHLGFRIQGSYSEKTPVLDLQEGAFTSIQPSHGAYLAQKEAEITAMIARHAATETEGNIQLNKQARHSLLLAYHGFLKLHIPSLPELRSLKVLTEVL